MPLPYEPKRKNRWILRFPDDLGIQEWWLSRAARPTIHQNEVEIPFINTSTWVLGRFIWNAIPMTMRDAIGPSTAQVIMDWIRLHSESVSGRQGYAAGYKKDVELEMLDPTGVAVEKWVLQNSWLSNDTNFGDLDYSQDALAEITMNLRFDRAILVY